MCGAWVGFGFLEGPWSQWLGYLQFGLKLAIQTIEFDVTISTEWRWRNANDWVSEYSNHTV
jgi:hypothetical protein